VCARGSDSDTQGHTCYYIESSRSLNGCNDHGAADDDDDDDDNDDDDDLDSNSDGDTYNKVDEDGSDDDNSDAPPTSLRVGHEKTHTQSNDYILYHVLLRAYSKGLEPSDRKRTHTQTHTHTRTRTSILFLEGMSVGAIFMGSENWYLS
jgi:hypothetical protein